MANNKIYVIGAGGLTGYEVVARLQKYGKETVAVVRVRALVLVWVALPFSPIISSPLPPL